jgi:HK97 gp10 family phage protein
MASSGLHIKMEGFDDLLKTFQKAPEVIQDDFKVELEDAAKAIQGEAKEAAPVNLSILRNSIVVDPPQNNGLTQSVSSLAEYSAYIEFGTGTKVSIALDDDVRAYEETFKTGKNIPGMYARPFLFPAVFRQTPILLDRLKKTLQKALTKA